MTVLRSRGAKVFISVLAIVELRVRRFWISPAWRCEKKSIGSRSTFHMKDVEPITAILPLILSE